MESERPGLDTSDRSILLSTLLSSRALSNTPDSKTLECFQCARENE